MKSYHEYLAGGEVLQVQENSSRYVIVSPVTEEPIGEVAYCSLEQLNGAIEAARTAQLSWATSSLTDRRVLLERLHQAISDRAEQFAVVLAEEIGCPIWLGRLMQVPMALRDLECAIEGMNQIVWNERVGNGLVERVPVGVIGAITPWNFPLHQIVAKVAGALAAGCSIVIKPSEISAGVAKHFIDAVQAAKVPPGLINVVWGGTRLGQALVDSPKIDQISFTGSTAVGRQVMAAAAARTARVTLELGGKSAAVLLDDADLDAALPIVLRSGLVNSGQTCVSQSRIIVPRRVLSEIEAQLLNLINNWQPGDPMDEKTRLGPVATRAQFEKINQMLAKATAQGAKILCGGPGRATSMSKGWYMSPTLLMVDDPSIDIAREEIFGPVVTVLGYDNEDHAVELSNATPYGLSGAVWSASANRAQAFASQMRTGQVVLNGAPQNLATPFGGWGQSGLGRENGRYGIEDCLQYRSIHGVEFDDNRNS